MIYIIGHGDLGESARPEIITIDGTTYYEHLAWKKYGNIDNPDYSFSIRILEKVETAPNSPQHFYVEFIPEPEDIQDPMLQEWHRNALDFAAEHLHQSGILRPSPTYSLRYPSEEQWNQYAKSVQKKVDDTLSGEIN